MDLMSILLTFLLILCFEKVAGQYYNGDDGIEKIYVRAGSNVSLPCHPAEDSSNILQVEWWKEDKRIVEMREEKMTVWEAEPEVSILPDSYALHFRLVTYRVSGEYQCIVNGKGEKNGILRLFVQDIPDRTGMPLIMGFTSRSVNLSWAPSVDNHFSPIIHYIIHVRVGEKGQWESNGILTPDNRTNYQVIGLQPYTVYSFRILAVNAIGASQPSKPSYYIVTLREAPDGKPTIISAHNTSSSSIRLQWAPPHKDTINGEFLGYRILYRPRDRPGIERERILRNSSLKEYTIRNLEPFTQYLITLQVFNPEGRGPPVSVAVMTEEGEPSKPQNFTCFGINNTTVWLNWTEPDYPNGIIKGYTMYWQSARNEIRNKTVYNPQTSMKYAVSNLIPYTKYSFWVEAFTSKNQGEPTEKLEVWTDVKGPSAPNIVNLTCHSIDTIYVQWERPQIFHKSVDHYYVYYRSEKSWDFTRIDVNATDQEKLISNLTTNTMYEVKICGVTRSIIEQQKLYQGQFSESRKVLLQSNCQSSVSSLLTESSVNAGLIAGIVCASFAFILAIIFFILWRKYFQADYYYLDDPPGNRASPQLSESFEDPEYASIPVHQFADHVAKLHADGDHGFSGEYQAIQQATDLDLSFQHSQMVENKNKNRYVNIVAYDHSRVILKPLPGQKRFSDYINANYIDGYGKARAYIGTQGPLPSTFDDYWRMIWEQRVYIIVMITNLVERGRRKCDMYWPKEGNEVYGIIQVKMINEVTMATYTLRTFTIRNLKIKKKRSAERTVYQYHYTNWPDHGVPDHPLPVLSFVRKSSAANPANGGPIIVHCSAGVGRTGTYIVIDAMLKQISHRQSINAFGYLKHIRQQRNFLVQTEDQYIFIHDALLEAIESGDTEVSGNQLPRYIQMLQTAESVDGEKGHWPLLEKQFKLVTAYKPKDFNLTSAMKSCNKLKNRSLDLLPMESYRVHITPKPGTDGSDYINATFLPGFNKLREFIITQHPTYDSIADFWQMVWDHNSQTIVLLSTVDEKEYPSFWPGKDEEHDYSTFIVKLTEECSQENFITRDFILQAVEDEYEVMCRIIQCAGWPESCSPLSSVFDLINVVQDWHLEYQNGPMVVIDRFGGTEAGTFCCLSTLFKQFKHEHSVDVYMYAKLYHTCRPGVWKTQDDYLFLYRALESKTENNTQTETDPCLANALIPTNGHLTSNGHVVKLDTNSQKSDSPA
ncbi:putative receptor-type tyrosine-protein phosphatase mosPTP-1 isoform X1 [Tachypleus tridentatus]|uniref:putative receptor-type tyrosine-protein phosphatase mosPTP-1 isoform X1 n=1 Tax=Tachypleus tridentatus TaxID=6853 RepID=UPI003FD18E1B